MADEPEDQPATGDDQPTDLGDAGKKALDAERKARRDAERRVKELEEQQKARDDQDKTEVERLTERLTTAEKAAADALARADRLEVAVVKALDEPSAKRITTAAKRLVGTNREELEADADDLLASFASDTSEPPPPGKPREQLRGGGNPQEEPTADIRQVVADIPRGI
jgi:hypothetical protein